MRTLIVYGTTERHTRGLCLLKARVLTRSGNEPDIRDAGATIYRNHYDTVLIAASLHVGRYQATVVGLSLPDLYGVIELPSHCAYCFSSRSRSCLHRATRAI